MDKRKGFTLIEVLIALTIFSAIMMVSVNTFVISFNSTRRTYTENVILEDARFILKRLASMIQENQIDYEEYFSHAVVQSGISSRDRAYGQNHGLYAWQFFDGGRNLGTGLPDGFGSLCQDVGGNYLRYPHDDCFTGPLAVTEDNSTGTHPAQTAERAPNSESDVVFYTNAVCVPVGEGYYNFEGQLVPGNSCNGQLTLEKHYRQSELYLISPDGSSKYMIKQKKITGSVVTLSMVKMTETESPDEKIRVYECASEYLCSKRDGYGNSIPGRKIPTYFDFTPITPLRTDIVSVDFIITPLDDPNKAFAENFSEVRMQPQVTILLTVAPTRETDAIIPREQLEITLQTTVSTMNEL